MGNACIAIGIGRTEGLAALPGAVNGARQIARWAGAAGYDVELVIDEDDEGKPLPVTIARISEALMRLLPTANDGIDRGGPADPPARLIVYFAGHGMVTMSNDDLWLLSDSSNDQLAIGITQLQDMLKTYQPGQIGIISDACRSPATANWNVRMVPMPVIPRGPYDPNAFDQIDVDRFLAVPPLTSAYMVRATPTSAARCIFTSVVLEALHGVSPECFDHDRTDVVTSDSIARYLRKNVKMRAAQFQVEMRPQTYPCWLEPDAYINQAQLLEINFDPLDPWPANTATGSQGSPDDTSIYKSFGGASGIVRGGPRAGGPLLGMAAPPDPEIETGSGGGGQEAAPQPLFTDEEIAQLEEERILLAQQMEALHARQVRIEAALARTDRITHLETGCGLTVAGATLVGARTRPGIEFRPDDTFDGSWQVDFHTGSPRGLSSWLTARLDDGSILATTALGGYVTDCVCEPEGCASASFREMWLNPTVRLPSEEICARGELSGADADDALSWIAAWREAMIFDPMLGVLAAYLFNAAGRTNGVRRLAGVYAARGLPLPFDIALLSCAPTSRNADGSLMLHVPAVQKCRPRTAEQRMHEAELAATDALDIPVAGAFPLVRQGWFQLQRAREGLVLPGLIELAPLLKPSLFATFDAEAEAPLAAALGA